MVSGRSNMYLTAIFAAFYWNYFHKPPQVVDQQNSCVVQTVCDWYQSIDKHSIFRRRHWSSGFPFCSFHPRFCLAP
uniref:Uncharacterized protein n=1 Tax=Arundo donax TaxID=35708 RepID=A0A0A9FG76_ARUDO